MDIDKIKTAMADFTARLNAKFRENPSSAVTAQDADRVGNQTPAQFATAISADATAHIARRDNPHGETAASIGSEIKTNVDYKAVGRVPTGVLPVSRFGSLNFLPIGVGGGFEGAIHPSDNLHIAMNMEDDGTLVILRPGTDGNVRGIYYAYITDPLLPGKTIDIRTTSREYRPSFVPASYEYVRLLRSCKEAVFAYMRDPATNEEYFMIAWTQGSYDDAGHTGVLIPRSATPAWINTVGSLDIVYANGRFWITFLTSQAGFGLRVMSVDAEEVRLGTATSLRDELGWETVNFYGDTVNHDIIQLAPVATSDVLANKPYILANQLGGGTLSVNVIRSNQDRTMQHSVLDKTTGRILMYIENQVGVNWTEPGTAGGGTWAPFVSSLWIDVVNRKAGVLGAPVGSSSPLTAPLTISNALGGNGVEYSGPLAARIKTSVNDRGTDYIYIPVKDGNGADTLARYTSSVNWYGTYSHTIAWHRYGPTVKLSDLLDSSQSLSATSTQSSPFRSQFGGSFGRRFGNPAFFSPTRVYVNCEGNRGNGAYAQLEAVGDAGTDWDFTYRSLNNGSIQGSVPRSWRSTIDEFAPGKSGLLDGLMHEFNISTPSSFVLNQANFSKDVRATAGRGLKADISETTTLIVQMAVLEQLHAKIVALATAQGLSFVDTADTVRSSWVILQNAPSFAQGMVLDTDGRIHLFVARCEPNTKTGTVTSYTFSDNTLKYIRGSNGFTRLYYSTGTQRRYPAGYAAETPNYWSYNLPSGWTLQQNGSSSLSRTTLLFNKNTGLFDVATLSSSGWQNDSSAIIFIPGHGICHSRCTSTEGDLLSKLVYNVRHVTEAEIVNGTIHDPTLRVLLSMLKPEQWNVTFSEDTDLIMSGRAYVLAAGTYMLSDVTPDPANKTFYVYVRVVAGRALYHFSLTELPESSSLMFVGTVVTGSAGITTVDIRKVTRLGKYRLSTTAVGSAIAVSLGAPQDTNKLNWT